MLRRRLRSRVFLIAPLLIAACGSSGKAKIENLQDSRELTSYRLKSVTGTRDGDLFKAQVVFASGLSVLTMKMRFRIGVPTHLESGVYRWRRDGQLLEGPIAERSVTFLGGQSGRPGLGGTFTLLSPGGRPLYEVTVPTSEVTRPRRALDAGE
jgi:hypothetical protein